MYTGWGKSKANTPSLWDRRGDELAPPAVEAWSLNCWTTKEVTNDFLFKRAAALFKLGK